MGSRPFPQKPHIPFRATYVMDCSALKLGQENINTVGRDDLPCFGAEAVLSFSAYLFPQMMLDWVDRNGRPLLNDALFFG